MKIFKIMAIALVAMLGFTACDNDPEHIYDDHSADLVGTWTCITDNYAEALVINADGTAVSYGVEDGEYWENVRGTVVVKDGNITMTFEDNDNFTGHFDIIPGQAFSLYEDSGERYVYNYCKEDLSEEIVGMWVLANGTPDMTIETYYEDGRSTFTGIVNGETTLKHERNYKVVGDLSFHTAKEDPSTYVAQRLIYSPNATSYGDLMTWQLNNDFSFTRLRIKQSLDLKSNRKYDFIKAYVSNAKGKDEDFNITDCTFNMSNIASGDFDVMFRSVLFCVELNANSIKQNFMDGEFETPITVDGNKVTLNMNAANPAFRDVDMYMFQDNDNTQLHIYMSTSSFINYMANLKFVTMIKEGKIDAADATAVEKIHTDMEARVESINLALVLRARE